jgi:hypothetical protein
MKKIALVLVITLTLSACFHNNPLKTQPKRQSAVFLMNASANVEKRLQFAIKKGSYGYGYLECMEGKKSPEINCRALYQGMVVFAKEGHYPAFKSVTIWDLRDKQFFETIGDDYAEVAITTWPHYFPVSQS